LPRASTRNIPRAELPTLTMVPVPAGVADREADGDCDGEGDCGREVGAAESVEELVLVAAGTPVSVDEPLPPQAATTIAVAATVKGRRARKDKGLGLLQLGMRGHHVTGVGGITRSGYRP